MASFPCTDGVRGEVRDHLLALSLHLAAKILNAHEFIRRFLTHVLPDKFVRIRFYGFLANSCKSKKISQILELLEHSRPHTTIANQKETIEDLMYRLTGVDITLCPTCKKGKLQTIKTLPNFKQLQNNDFYNNYWDTS